MRSIAESQEEAQQEKANVDIVEDNVDVVERLAQVAALERAGQDELPCQILPALQ